MDNEFIRASFQKLRADLMATNKALTAIVSTLPPQQRDAVLKQFAQVSVLSEETAAAMSRQAAPGTLQAMQEADERMYKLLQNAHGRPGG